MLSRRYSFLCSYLSVSNGPSVIAAERYPQWMDYCFRAGRSFPLDVVDGGYVVLTIGEESNPIQCHFDRYYASGLIFAWPSVQPKVHKRS